MALAVACDVCGQRHDVKSTSDGKSIRCRQCGVEFAVSSENYWEARSDDDEPAVSPLWAALRGVGSVSAVVASLAGMILLLFYDPRTTWVPSAKSVKSAPASSVPTSSRVSASSITSSRRPLSMPRSLANSDPTTPSPSSHPPTTASPASTPPFAPRAFPTASDDSRARMDELRRDAQARMQKIQEEQRQRMEEMRQRMQQAPGPPGSRPRLGPPPNFPRTGSVP
jgi:hypothetical protein